MPPGERFISDSGVRQGKAWAARTLSEKLLRRHEKWVAMGRERVLMGAFLSGKRVYGSILHWQKEEGLESTLLSRWLSLECASKQYLSLSFLKMNSTSTFKCELRFF